MTTPTQMPESLKVPEELAAIQRTLAYLPSDCLKPWRSLDRLPYLHATDDPAASPWGTPVVGRFDYMETKDYIAACNPAAMANVLEHISALQSALKDRDAEIERLKKDAERYRWLREQEWFNGELCVLLEPKRVLTRGIGLGADCPSHDRLDAAIDSMKGDAS